jgi:hypothetical protein
LSKARDIVSNALTFRLNRLSPGETLDADTAALCLAALNEVIDQFNGLGSFLTREILTPGVCNGVSGTLGTTWPGLAYGDTILGATVSYAVGLDNPIDPLTMEQYQGIAQKATASIPLFYAPDGGAGLPVARCCWPDGHAAHQADVQQVRRPGHRLRDAGRLPVGPVCARG